MQRALLFAIGIVACDPSPDDTARDDVEHIDPAESGPWGVGATTIEVDVTYADGSEGQLEAEVWYPYAGGQATPGAYPVIAIEREARRNVPLAPDAPVRPLILFSHGLGGTRVQSVFLMEHLASHGWTIVAPDHPGSRFYDPGYIDGVLASAIKRPPEISATLEAVYTAMNAPFADAIDPELGVVMSGHSFGAFTTLMMTGGVFEKQRAIDYCIGEDRSISGCNFITDEELLSFDAETSWDPLDHVVASLPLSPGLAWAFSPASLAAFPPTLVLGGTYDTVLGYDNEVVPTYEALGSPKVLATSEKAGHYGYSDLCVLKVLPFPDCATEGWQPVPDVQAAANEVVAGWLGQNVAADPAYADWTLDRWAERDPLRSFVAE